MFGTEPRVRRPVLLLLVFGAFIALVGITAAAQATLVTTHFTAVTMQAVVDGDLASVRRFASAKAADGGLATTDLAAGVPLDPARRAVLEEHSRRSSGATVGFAMRSCAGPTARSWPRSRARRIRAASAAAMATHPDAAIVAGAEAGVPAADLDSPWILRERLPITDTAGNVVGVVALWRDGVPILARLDEVRRDVLIVTLTAAMLAAILLFLIFRSAQGRLTRQTGELVESTRRDPLTGTLNHGALVSLLATRLEAARTTRRHGRGSPSSTSTTSRCSTTTTGTASATTSC